MAFVVNRGYFPERSFVLKDSRLTTSGPTHAAVCIEGIRADWHLPGFSRGFCALLSVRNNKKFRTTVSRQNLEVDEEYGRIAKLCARSLFTHVESEVERISTLDGHPLLGASTAGRIVLNSLLHPATMEVKDVINNLSRKLRLVVVESIKAEQPSLENRNLLSINDVQLMSHFWTIESRAADYLGIISEISVGN